LGGRRGVRLPDGSVRQVEPPWVRIPANVPTDSGRTCPV